MKLIEALKQIKDLQRKTSDVGEKIKVCSAHMDYETPMYPDQKKQVSEWLQARHDLLNEILKLRIGIQRTNLETQVTIELGGKQVSKSIAEWIHRRRDLATTESLGWNALTDRGLKEGTITQSNGELKEVKIVRCYEPSEKDTKLELFASEPSIIDARLEVINAVTDIIL